MKVYCLMNGTIKALSDDEQKQLYKKTKLIKAEHCLMIAEYYLKKSIQLLEESKYYDK